ncbi:hypothetical protein DUNSADRAFT_617 [Dunaliella salina]|uniref:Encoded protein n=1 Tax=Dunaliella salina TaxID=3046 RepID=A0ABQ7FYP7_DUNSA|nr:hypothetical protein DUNSADRAFT_617 [Dunaliella salina]|eukprot:KAF5827466.1 hypothetical protein DUNSADRAFT_617 [Dunaliella salina]
MMHALQKGHVQGIFQYGLFMHAHTGIGCTRFCAFAHDHVYVQQSYKVLHSGTDHVTCHYMDAKIAISVRKHEFQGHGCCPWVMKSDTHFGAIAVWRSTLHCRTKIWYFQSISVHKVWEAMLQHCSILPPRSNFPLVCTLHSNSGNSPVHATLRPSNGARHRTDLQSLFQQQRGGLPSTSVAAKRGRTAQPTEEPEAVQGSGATPEPATRPGSKPRGRPKKSKAPSEVPVTSEVQSGSTEGTEWLVALKVQEGVNTKLQCNKEAAGCWHSRRMRRDQSVQQ